MSGDELSDVEPANHDGFVPCDACGELMPEGFATCCGSCGDGCCVSCLTLATEGDGVDLCPTCVTASADDEADEADDDGGVHG